MANYLYKNSEIVKYLERDYLSSTALSVKLLNDAMISPSCKIKGGGQCADNQCIEAFIITDGDKKTNNEFAVVYIGDFSTQHYGNVLIDYLSRLWYCSKDNKVNLVYTSKKLCIENSTSYMHILTYLNIEKTQLHLITEPTLFSKVYVPERSMIHDRYITEEYAQIYENIWQSIQDSYDVSKIQTFDKIYVTRRKLKKHKEIGEYVFERFFEMNSFKVIAPETLSFEEQVCLFRNAKEIASIEGTHAHNIIFKGTSKQAYKQIIMRKQSEVIPRQIQLNQITGGDAIWIDIYSEPFKGFPISHDRGPFLLKWNEQIEKYAKANNMVLPCLRKMYAIPNIIEYTYKCIGYWLKHNMKQIYIRLKKKDK